MARDMLKYLATPPTSWREWTYRVVVIVLLGLIFLRYVRLQQTADSTSTQIQQIATVVATATAD